jgi:diguanylate cyclase (GGDEF)-like protein/PAS domain S-box-containing protein
MILNNFFKNEDIVQLFLEHAPAAMAMFDAHMHYLAVSQRWIDDYNLGDMNVIGLSHYEVFPEIPQRWREVHKRALEGETIVETQDQFQRINGEMQWLKWEVRPWYTINGTIGGIIISTENITQTKIYESKLKKEIAYHQQLIETSLDGIAIISSKEQKIIETNQRFADMLGYTKEELYKLHTWDFDAMISDSQIKEQLYEHTQAILCTRHKRKDKTTYDAEVSIGSTLIDGVAVTFTVTRDVTEQKDAEKKLHEFVALIDKNVLISTTDLNGVITNVSEAFCKLSGYSKDELIGKSHKILKHPDIDAAIFKNLWDTITADKTWQGELKNRKKDGTLFWSSITISPIYDSANQKIGYTAIRQDTTDKKIIEQLSITDPLTGIYNRRHLDTVFPIIVNSAKRNNKYVSFVILDIDYFKKYNDTYGHQAGDRVLIDIAATLSKHLKLTTDYCFRLGGEEFIIIYESQNQDDSLHLAVFIKEAIDSLKIVHKKNPIKPNLTVSMGLVVMAPEKDMDLQTAYKFADEMLYTAKKQGRDQILKYRFQT